MLTAALSFSSCATSRKAQTKETQTVVTVERHDTVERVVVHKEKEAVPQSMARIEVPADSLMRLPEQALLRSHSGQASAEISRRGDIIYVTATCDSLERMVEYYESRYQAARKALDSLDHNHDSTTEKKQSCNPFRTALYAFLAGLAAGAFITTMIIRKYRNEKK